MPESSGATSFIFLGERIRAQELYAQVNSHLCLTDRQASESPAIGTAVVRESSLSHSPPFVSTSLCLPPSLSYGGFSHAAGNVC